MPARLKPMIVRARRAIRQSVLDDWQKIADEQTAKEFERYSARLKMNSNDPKRLEYENELYALGKFRAALKSEKIN